MAGKGKSEKRPIEQYEHKDKKRVNNPPVGLVTPETDKNSGTKKYAYDPHLDPQLVWAGKAEHTSFEIPTVSLHVHERIDPRSIIEAIRKKNGNNYEQMSLFSAATENPPLREAVDFYRHPHEWSNRLVAGDSLLVMNSLIEKEGLREQVQMVYFDPPYGIEYGSNFQPFTNNRSVKDGKDEDLSQEPETIKAFRDTWELGIHSYLSYLRDRLLLTRELLSETGSCFVQISDQNIHHVKELMDEIFGKKNFFSLITFRTSSPLKASGLPRACDYLIWYAKDIDKVKYHQLYEEKEAGEGTNFTWLELKDGSRRLMTDAEKKRPKMIPDGSKIFYPADLASSGYTESCTFSFKFEGRNIPAQKKSWRTNRAGIQKLIENKRIMLRNERPCFVQYFDDFPFQPIKNFWLDTRSAMGKRYVVETDTTVIERCILMTTDPSDLVFDPTCGSGATAFVAENHGRRWITCDTSRVAVTLAKQRLMTADYDYFSLQYADEGISSGFKYLTVPHVTLGMVANEEPADQETIYSQPLTDKKRARVTGPFTVEAVPAPSVAGLDSLSPFDAPDETDRAVARTGQSSRQADWRDELLKAGVRGKQGQRIEFSRVEAFPGTRWLHADCETKEKNPQRAVVSFGPEHAPLSKEQVQSAIEEAQKLVPKPKLIAFASFHFDPEAARDIDETNWPSVSLIKVQMNTDLLTDDLKKRKSSNESFWLIGQPDIKVFEAESAKDRGKYGVEVKGFDYFNTKTGAIESGGTEKIAVWMLDTDFDGRSLFPRQVFFPMAGKDEGWDRIGKNLKAEIDEDLIEAFRGTESLLFEPGKHKRIAIKIVDDRGIESLKVVELKK